MHCTVKQWKQFIRICILCCIELIYRMRMQIEIDNFGFTLLTIFLSVCFFLFFFYFSFFCLSFSRKLTKVEVARLNVFQMRRFRSFSNHKNQEDSESSYNSWTCWCELLDHKASVSVSVSVFFVRASGDKRKTLTYATVPRNI